MDELHSKLRVIHWCTNYKSQLVRRKKKLCVELTDYTRMSKWFISAPSVKSLMEKLDDFILIKVKL